ncbi:MULTISPECIES: DUF6207 family protein [unclassified Streptomyces]|uniref:DUF6207 family protein n=1 Tax=unclassified Streptomyces TaxID=2593676 RepID=UPI00344619AF
MLAARCAVVPAERTTREPDEPGVQVRFFLDLQQDADTSARGRHLAVLVPGHDGASAAGRRGRPCGRLLGLWPVGDGAAAGIGLAGEGGEPREVLRRAHPCRWTGRAALQQLRHRGLLVGVDLGGPGVGT